MVFVKPSPVCQPLFLLVFFLFFSCFAIVVLLAAQGFFPFLPFVSVVNFFERLCPLLFF